MAQINLGTTANDGTGTTLRAAGAILNDTGLRKNNFAGSTTPGASDDSTDGYEVGSMWADLVLDQVWVCMDATAASAVWLRLELSASAVGLTPVSSIADDDRLILEDNTGAPVSAPAASVIRGDGTVLRTVQLTAAAYAALTPKIATTQYLIVG